MQSVGLDVVLQQLGVSPNNLETILVKCSLGSALVATTHQFLFFQKKNKERENKNTDLREPLLEVEGSLKAPSFLPSSFFLQQTRIHKNHIMSYYCNRSFAVNSKSEV